MRRLMAVFVLMAATVAVAPAWQTAPERRMVPGPQLSEDDPDTLKFAVIGDNGTGEPPQYDVGREMADARWWFPFELVLMLGDNLYGSQTPRDFVNKFERPYAPILECQVRFYAALGNHDQPSNRNYGGFNMGGERYYTFVRKHVRFFVFDTNLMDAKQVAWIADALRQAQDPWKIAYFHHPLYSDAGRHGPDVELRVVLEPLLIQGGVNVVFSGHEHVYERLKPQKGITYFVEGASGQLRRGDITPSPQTAAWFDRDQSFMLVEIAGDALTFHTVARTGEIVDSGVIHRRPTT